MLLTPKIQETEYHTRTHIPIHHLIAPSAPFHIGALLERIPTAPQYVKKTPNKLRNISLLQCLLILPALDQRSERMHHPACLRKQMRERLRVERITLLPVYLESKNV